MYDDTEKEALVHVNIRLPKKVLEYYKEKYPAYTKGLRKVLVAEYNRVTSNAGSG